MYTKMATVTTSNRTPKSWREFFALNGNALSYAGERSDEVENNPSKPYCLNLQGIDGIVKPVSTYSSHVDTTIHNHIIL